MRRFRNLLLLILIALTTDTSACSIVYFIDSKTGKIYFVNNEDYWYDVKPYIQIIPGLKGELGRIWYGWNNFGQGGVNEKGLVIDGATTPQQNVPAGYSAIKGNMTDYILAKCSTVDEALHYLEDKRIALKNAHIILGDQKGKAVIVEWVDEVKHIIPIQNNRLAATNFNISDNTGAKTCWRYPIIEKVLDELDARNAKDTITIKDVGNVIGKTVQPPQKDSYGRLGGTIYSTFIDLTDMKFILVYKFDNSKMQRIDIVKELHTGTSRKIKLE
ncbi:carcinine hydrolase/isopenicillin-N N-acyltransferase family protein [Flavobacterium sp. 2]|uniref:carcinine hydrolase/isopenicillin-N N-acyltransferase family protein n=1 Tax=Flavobacterium sp. 2 TaxID=308053 RepID=UPI003CE6C9FB